MKKTICSTLLLISAIFILGRAVDAEEGEIDSWDGPFFFIQMADPQFGYYAAGEAKMKKAGRSLAEGFVKSTGPYKETTLFTQAIQHANRLKPDFVIICGDLTQNGGRIPEELQALHKVKLLLDESIPLWFREIPMWGDRRPQRH